MRVVEDFVTDQEAGLYFWRTDGVDGVEVQLSNRPHPKLPNYCKEHDWWSDKACPAPHGERIRIIVSDGLPEEDE